MVTTHPFLTNTADVADLDAARVRVAADGPTKVRPSKVRPTTVRRPGIRA
jgi:hypothetical protein